MKRTVQVNRSQFDAMPVVVLPIDGETYVDSIAIGTEVHVFTDAELRARDVRVALAAQRWRTRNPYTEGTDYNEIFAMARLDDDRADQ